MIRKTLKQFIIDANKIHNNFYIYIPDIILFLRSVFNAHFQGMRTDVLFTNHRIAITHFHYLPKVFIKLAHFNVFIKIDSSSHNIL